MRVPGRDGGGGQNTSQKNKGVGENPTNGTGGKLCVRLIKGTQKGSVKKSLKDEERTAVDVKIGKSEQDLPKEKKRTDPQMKVTGRGKKPRMKSSCGTEKESYGKRIHYMRRGG